MLAYRWIDSQGGVHIVPHNGCVVCKHSTDIFMDPFHFNMIYGVSCDYKVAGDDKAIPNECPYFEKSEEYINKIPFETEVK